MNFLLNKIISLVKTEDILTSDDILEYEITDNSQITKYMDLTKNTHNKNLSDIPSSITSSNMIKILEHDNNLDIYTKNSKTHLTNNSTNSSNSTKTDTDTDNEQMMESTIEKKYINWSNYNKKYYEDKREIKNQNLRTIEINIIKNNYTKVLNLLNNGDVLYKKDLENNIVKICSNKNCSGQCEKNICNKNGVYYSLWNNTQGIKSVYNLLLRLLYIYPQFREKCKCCEDKQTQKYFENLESEYNKNVFIYTDTNTKKLEYKINFLINKFIGTLSVMSCQCKFIDKYYEFYQETYLNFKNVNKIYKKTVPYIL